MTTQRATTGAIVLAAALLAAACSPPEKRIVDQYFNAVNSEDTQTLSSFAAHRFPKKVQSWKIASVSEEAKESAPLPGLTKAAADAETEVDKNKRAAQVWAGDLEVYKQIDEIKELRKKNAAVPPRLSAVAQKYDDFGTKERELKKALAQAKDAAEQEKRYVALSVGQVDGIETAEADMLTKQVALELTVEGQAQPHTMTLRRYNLKGDTGQRVISRWVVMKIDAN
jgi:hypothetical protein